MKKYIFFTADIYSVGGMQSYVAGKAKYLKENGFKVFVFYCSNSKDDISFPALREYEGGNLKWLAVFPNQLLDTTVKLSLTKMEKIVGNDEDDQIFIESHYDKAAIWGELLASKMKAKHVCLNCNEVFRGRYKHYVDYMGFFWFKYNRNELAGISAKSMKLLFEGFYDVNESEELVFSAKPDDPVQDVYNEKVNNVCKDEENICYIGRIEKECFEFITQGVFAYAKKYPQTKIQYIIVGQSSSYKMNQIIDMFINLKNVKITFLGNLVPIPRSLFDKVDVVAAAAGCATLSAKEGVFTIVADANTGESNGVLGYDTNDVWFSDKHFTYVESFENVFKNKKYSINEIHLKKEHSKEYYYQETIDRFYQTFDGKYYDNKKLLNNKRLLSKGTLNYYFWDRN